MKDSYTSPDQDSTPPLLPGSGQITQKRVNRLISERVASSPAGTRHKAVEAWNGDDMTNTGRAVNVSLRGAWRLDGVCPA